MVTRKPYPAGSYYWYCSKIWQAASLALVGLLLFAALPKHLTNASASLPHVFSGNAIAVSAALDASIAFTRTAIDAGFISDQGNAPSLPLILSAPDKLQYAALFQAQKNADWQAADAALPLIKNDLLLGHALAQRYRQARYSPSPQELQNWLNRYADLPEAAEIYNLAISAYPQLRGTVTEKEKKPLLAGYGDDHGSATQDETTAFYSQWAAAIHAWRTGNKIDAARQFSALASSPDAPSPWNASAAAYWAYRANKAIGNKAKARQFLHAAADVPRSFYGILARKQLKEPLELDNTPPALADSDILELYGNPAIKRILALCEVDMPDLAEQEVRALFLQLDEQDKFRLLALAHRLHLASAEIAMAGQLRRSGHELDFARYPTPRWQPARGFTVDPSLIYALARQESGFHATAVSTGGALGLMQLMPNTALLMQKRLNKNKADNLSLTGNVAEPVLNMTLGQHYVERLLDNGAIDDNLIYLLAAYNAGPGKLQEWKEQIDSDDPLLFIETIPFAQTRHYIMQVMANYWIYSELEGKDNPSIAALIHGEWPSYEEHMTPLATNYISTH